MKENEKRKTEEGRNRKNEKQNMQSRKQAE